MDIWQPAYCEYKSSQVVFLILGKMKDGIHQALFSFVDFIYAVVFALIIQQSFDEIINKDGLALSDILPRLLLLMAVFYFLAWDWILGRILTLRNPYQSYSRFFFEVLIATCAYGTASAAIKGKSVFLLYFAAVFCLGGMWAKRTERQVSCVRDQKELCVIQSLQWVGACITAAFYFQWKKTVPDGVSWTLAIIETLNIWCFILVYEMMVPRYRGISAGPGVPFLARPNVRRIRRRLLYSNP
jgi:hypothetical protein